MEKNVKRFRQLIVSLFVLLICFTVVAETPSLVRHIRFPIWAEVDAYPGLELKQEIAEKNKKSENFADDEAGDKSVDDEGFGDAGGAQSDDDENKPYSYAVGRIKEISPFLVRGMVYGWEFTYVPSDKARWVSEFLEIKEIQTLEKSSNQIVYSSPWIEDNKFCCWVDYERTDHQVQTYNLWSSINNPVIQGRGYGPLEKGFDGIKEASEDALKNAVRNFYRKKIKNKPKEITGKVLIRKVPTLGIDQGRYVIILDFFLEYGKIKEYSQF